MKSRIFLCCSILLLAFFVHPKNITLAATDAFDLVQARIVGDSPLDVAGWDSTATITSINISSGVNVSFDKADGPNRWPDQRNLGISDISPNDPLQYTVWLFREVNGTWTGAGFIRRYYGQAPESGTLENTPCDWFYYAPEMQPDKALVAGEKIGFMVTAGSARRGTFTNVRERSNVKLITVPSNIPAPHCEADSNVPVNNTVPAAPAAPASSVTNTEAKYFCAENVTENSAILGNSRQDKDPGGLDLKSCLAFCQTNKADACNFGVDPNTSTRYCNSVHGNSESLYIKSPYSDWSYAWPQSSTCENQSTVPIANIKATQPLPVPNKGLPTDLGQLIAAIFTWSLSIIGLVIFVRFFYAGFKWAFLSAGNSAQVGEAKNMMKNAVYGALVLFSAYLILNTINPDLVRGQFSLPGLPGSQTPPVEEKIPPPADAATKHGNHAAEVAAAKNTLAAAGKTWIQGQPTQEEYECNRFEIINSAAKLIPGAGILSKPGGNNCRGYSVDIIVFSDGYIYDVLSGGASDGAGPSWLPSACGTVQTNGTCPDRYRQPISYP